MCFNSPMLDAFLFPAADGQSTRTMIVLHGLGDSARGYTWLPGALGLKDMNYILVNAPDEYYMGYSWYDYEGDPAPGVERSRKALLELISALETDGRTTDEIFLFGFSQGCLVAIDVAARSKEVFAGVMGISGKVFEPEQLIQDASDAGRKQRFLVTHGDNDPVIPIETTRPQIQMLRDAGFQIDWREFRKEHGFAEPEEIDAIRNFLDGRPEEIFGRLES